MLSVEWTSTSVVGMKLDELGGGCPHQWEQRFLSCWVCVKCGEEKESVTN